MHFLGRDELDDSVAARASSINGNVNANLAFLCYTIIIENSNLNYAMQYNANVIFHSIENMTSL